MAEASLVGGTTAVSGGLTWIPNNDHMSEVGIEDSYEEAYGYIRRNTLGRGNDALIDLYVKEGRRVIAYLQEHAGIDYGAVPHYPDYHPEFEGGRTGAGRWRGRSSTPISSGNGHPGCAGARSSDVRRCGCGRPLNRARSRTR